MSTVFEPRDILESIRLRFDNLVGSYSGPKCLYIEQPILKLLNFIFDLKFDEFKAEQNITQIYSFKFQNEKEEIQDNSDSKTIIFLLSPQIKWMRKIAEIVINNNTRNIVKDYLLLLTPKKSFLCLKELQQMHVKNAMRIQSFNFGLVPLSSDILSMELPKSYLDLFGKSDQTILQLVAESILKLQYALGDFDYIYGKGDFSNAVIQLVKAKDKDESYEHHESNFNISLVVIDRNVDLVTPLLTPFTYEGMLDNFYEIDLNQIMIPGDLVDPTSSKLQIPYQLYNFLDQIYSDLTSMSIYSLEQILKNSASKYRNQLQQIRQNKNMSIQVLNSLMENQGRQYLFIQHHTLLLYSIFKKTKSLLFEKKVTMQNQMVQTGNVVLDNIEQLAAFLSFQDWFRLVCLASSVHGGLKDKFLRSIQEIACRMYGMEHMFTANNLYRSGLLASFSKNNWGQIKQRFNLINNQEQIDSQKSKDYSYIYILYASLITRMVEEALKNNDEWTHPKYDLLKGKTTIVANSQSSYGKSTKPKLSFVYVIGGITYGQIHSLRQLSKKLGQKIIICSTKVSGGKGLIHECVER